MSDNFKAFIFTAVALLAILCINIAFWGGLVYLVVWILKWQGVL